MHIKKQDTADVCRTSAEVGVRIDAFVVSWQTGRAPRQRRDQDRLALNAKAAASRKEAAGGLNPSLPFTAERTGSLSETRNSSLPEDGPGRADEPESAKLAAARRQFLRADKDGSGRITRSELKRLCAAFGSASLPTRLPYRH